MSQQSNLSFQINFNGQSLTAHPSDTESLYEAMGRTVVEHAGCEVTQWGRCKKAGEHYVFPVTFANGSHGVVAVQGNA